MKDKERYVLYDGDCNFCSNIVDRISSLIKNENILFVPFTSKQARELISVYNIQNLNSVIYIDHNRIFYKSKAILNICKRMRFPYKYYYIFNIVPAFILDLAYDFIAKRRNYIT